MAISALTHQAVLRFELSETLADAERELRLSNHQVGMVVDHERYTGLINLAQIRSLLDEYPERAGQTLASLGPLCSPQIHRDSTPLSIRRVLQDNELDFVPYIDGRGHVSRCLSREEALSMGLYENPVVIMAGGFGHRLRPLTQSTPKPLLPLVDSSMLDWIIDHLVECGFHRFYVAVHYLKDQIMDYLGDGSQRGVSFEYLVEDTPRGTAGSLRELTCTEELPILVTNGDVITNQHFGEVLAFHRRQAAQLTVVCKEDGVDISYGVIETDGNGDFSSISEKPRLSFLINTGIYVIDPSILRLVPDERFFMTDLINGLRATGGRVGVFKTREYWRDVGTMDCYAQVIKDIHTGLVRSYPTPGMQHNHNGTGGKASGK
jgi:dTDP-glucose pyrophosphorylase